MRKLLPLLIPLLFLGGCYKNSFGMDEDYSSDLVDGSYRVTTTNYDEFGYKNSLKIMVVDGIITEAELTQTNKEGEIRTDDSSWGENVNYKEVLLELYSDTILNQGRRIDSVTGATETVRTYKKLIKQILQNARKGTPSEEEVSF